MLKRRTDLALEAKELWTESAEKETKLEGVRARDSLREGYQVTTVDILDEQGASSLGKPVGSYVTVQLDALARREEDAFGRAAGFSGRVWSTSISDQIRCSEAWAVSRCTCRLHICLTGL